jgi:hypothetical protein
MRRPREELAMPAASFDKVAAITSQDQNAHDAAANSFMGTSYALENGAPQAADHFDALRTIFDPGTISHLDRLGATRGWHCLEVGGGSGSIARVAERARRPKRPCSHLLLFQGVES